jgi:hypothetical protein
VAERVAHWLAVTRLGRERFTWVEDPEELPAQARADSFFWCDLVLAPEANPYREGGGVRHGFHLATRGTLDLLRHEVPVSGGCQALTITEGRNFLLVQLPCADVLALPRSARPAAIRRVAATLFRAAPALRLPAVLAERACFAAGARADPRLLPGQTARVDGGICRGSLYFLWYKKHGQRVGFLNGQQWFDDEFRRRHAGA